VRVHRHPRRRADINSFLARLADILSSSQLTLNQESLDVLWHVFVTGAASADDKNLLLDWLNQVGSHFA
jgi:hypothetical protein